MTVSAKQRAVAGNRAYLSTDDKIVAKGGFASGGEASQNTNKAGNVVLPGSAAHVAVFDDFIGPAGILFSGDTGSAAWIIGQEDTGQAFSNPAVLGGVARLTSSASSGQTPITGAMSLHGGAQWKANSGGLRLAGRVKIEQLSGSNVFLGFTDTGGSELPVYDTGSEVTATLTPAADAVGFLYSGSVAGALLGRTTWRAVASKAGTDQNTASTVTPVANVYDVLEVNVDSSGNASYYINNKLVTTLANAVTATTALAPHFGYAQTEAAAKFVDLDWINVSCDRDTGQ